MSTRRTRASTITVDQVKDLVLNLQALLPDSTSRCTTKVPASKILKQTCNYIKKLHKEVDDLSDKLSQLLDSIEGNDVDVHILRSLLQQ